MALWQLLSDPANHDMLGWLGGGVCVVASGLWVAIKHFTTAPARPAEAKPASARNATARVGMIAAAGNVTAGRDVVVGDVALPRMALWLAGLGLVLVAAAAIFGGGATTIGSVVTGGDVNGTVILGDD